MSNSSKRISVFDRLGPGTDEGSPHHRYGSEKHGSGSYGGGGQEKGRSHSYGSSGSSQHKDDGSQGRDRKSRLRSSGEAAAEGDAVEDKRPSVKGSRDNPEAVKGLSSSKAGRAGMPSGESDFEEGMEDGKRRKPHRGLGEEKGKLGVVDEEGHGSRRSGRDRKDKGSGRPEKPGSSSGGGDGLTRKSPDKAHSRREGGVVGPHDHKRRKEDEYKSELMAGHKRKRDVQDDTSFSPDPKKSRRRDLSRESDQQRHSAKDGDRYHYSIAPSSASGKDSDYHHGSNTDRKRRQDSSSILSESSRRKARLSQTPEPPDSGARGKSGRSYHRYDREDGRRLMAEGTTERKSEGGAMKSRSLDWTAVQAFADKANSKLQRQYSSVLDRFKPGVLLGEVKVSPALAGAGHYQRVREAILKDGGEVSSLWPEKKEAKCDKKVISEEKVSFEENMPSEEKTTSEVVTSKEEELGTDVEEDKMECELPGHEEEGQLTWDKLARECLLSCRRALTAADDYAIRRRLRKDHKGFLATARPTSDRWTTDQYATSIELYNFVPTKPSGKPATKELSSRVGSLIISR